MKTPGRLLFIVILLVVCLACLSACGTVSLASITSTDPLSTPAYILVTANPQPSNTPFQPSRPIDLPLTANPNQVPGLAGPTDTAAPAATEIPSQTAFASATDFPTRPPQATDTPLPTFTLVASGTPADSPTGLPVKTATSLPPTAALPPGANLIRPQYVISALMNYSGHKVTVSETVLYPNRTGAALSGIALAVNPNLWNGVFILQTLEVNDQASTSYTLAGQWLNVNLDTPLQAGQAVKIGIGYQLNLPYSAAKMENFGYTARQTNLIDWYPFVPPNISGKWILPDPYPYGENLVYDKSDFRISLSFSDPANPPVVAASAPASSQNGARFANQIVYALDNARNFTLSASTEYQVSTADANGVSIVNYYFPGDGGAAARVLDMTRLAVLTYTNEFGPYPHQMLTVCETDLNDGLETDGLYFLASTFYRAYDGTVRNNLSTIAVHETAHQWWYGAVANNQAVEPWLDEAMATYSERIFWGDNYPDLVTWWWAFRVDSKNPSGWVDSRVYDTSTFSQYVNAVYFNGAHFLDALRVRIGDKVFLAFLHDYFARENGRISSANDFFSILDLHTNTDISDLLKKYFYYR